MTTISHSNNTYSLGNPATECPYFVASLPEAYERGTNRLSETSDMNGGNNNGVDVTNGANARRSSASHAGAASSSSLSSSNHNMMNNHQTAGLPPVSFQPASIKTSNDDMIYALADGNYSATGNAGWFTVPWSQILQELRNNENLLLSLTKAVRLDSSMRSKMLQGLQTREGDLRASTTSSVGGALDFSDFSLASSLNPSAGNASSDALFANANGSHADTIWDSPLMNHQPNEPVQGTPLTSSADESPLSPAKASFWGFTPDSTRLHATGLPNIMPSMPAPINTAATVGVAASSALSPTAVPMLGKTFAKTLTASEDTIDRMILQERAYNVDTKEYVWSQLDATLYEIDDPQAAHVASEEGSIKMIFPPGTMLLCKEKDGATCSPAYTTSNPHSNEWLKTQVCHHKCAYRSSTASLKRPKTVREHFQKCVWLHEGHPLKVLSSLQLRVLERESQGLLPNRRRAARGGRPGHHPTAGGLASLQQSSSHSTPSYQPYPITRSSAVYSGHNGSASRSATPAAFTAPASKHSANDVTVFPPMMQYAQTQTMALPGQLDTPGFNMPMLRSMNSHPTTNTHMQMSYARHAQGAFSSGEDSPLTSNLSGPDSPMAR